jgi:hypothetical protein
MLPTPYVAYLRVYEPIETFSEHDRSHWNLRTNTETSSRAEQISSLRRVIEFQDLSNLEDGAHFIETSGQYFVAPWSTAHRCWSALNEVKSSFPKPVVDFFVPKKLEEILNLNSQVYERRIPHVLSETWMIPPRWFALFEPQERIQGKNSHGAFTIVRTRLELAKQRCIRTHQIVRQAFGPGPVEEELVQLLNWLNIFDTRSLVELDYGGLALYVESSLKSNGEAGIEADSSIEDVLKSLEGLAAGDGALAGSGYERLITRWRRVASFEQAM